MQEILKKKKSKVGCNIIGIQWDFLGWYKQQKEMKPYK